MLGYHPSNTSLVKLVPAHHFYQLLLRDVDFSFVRPLFEPFYSTIGRPSIDPVVFVKLLLVGHLENITSDRKLLELATMHVGIRAFLGYGLEQSLPWHSTLSRTRQRIPGGVFEACFSHIVGLCIHKGLVSGHTQVIDSAYIKANASMSRLKPKPALWSSEANPRLGKPKAPRLTASADRLQHIHRFHKNIRKAAPNKAGQLLSNLTHYSPTDPDARIAFKTGKPRQLAYMASVSVDAAQHVITHIQAGSADRRDSRNLLPIVDSTQTRLQLFGVVMSTVVADAGYCSGENYELLETRGLTGFIPPHGKYKDDRLGFRYDTESDSYTCSQGKRLTFDRLVVDKQGNPKKRYIAKASDCKSCPIREQCKGKKADEKRLHHTYYKAQYERMMDRLSSRFGKRMMRIRSATVEPVLGSLINYYGLGQINTRSREAAAKVMYVAAMAYNLKKYLRFTPIQPSGMVIALPLPDQSLLVLVYFCNSHCTYTTELASANWYNHYSYRGLVIQLIKQDFNRSVVLTRNKRLRLGKQRLQEKVVSAVPPSIRFLLQCMGILCLVYQDSFCQEVINFIPSTRYFLVDQCPFANKVVLSNGNDDRLTIEVVNILFNKSNQAAANSQPDYCLTMTVLPKNRFGQYPFLDTMWKKVSKAAIRERTLSYESLQKIIIKTDQYIIEQQKKDTNLIANNGLSMHLRTYNIIPVISSDNEFYIPDDADVLTEVFCIDYKPVKPADQVNGHLYLTNTGRANVDSLLDLSHRLVVDYGSLPEQYRKPSVYYDKYLCLTKWAYKNIYQFVHLQVHRGFIGHYYSEYSTRAYYGVGTFLFSPCIGLVGGTYSSYLRTFYDWIPGVKRDFEVMFTAKSVNGIDFENSIINTCR